MIKRIVLLMISVSLCASFAQAGITAIGDVDPYDPAILIWNKWTDGIIGNTGAGSLNVGGNSDLISDTSVIGNQSGSWGSVAVGGNGSSWTVFGYLYVGHRGMGTLYINNGGAVSDYGGYIGYESGSTGAVRVSGAGASWTTGTLSVGCDDDGTLDIDSGGAVISQSGGIGTNSGSTGEVTVSGADSTWTTSGPYGYLSVGVAGDGTLDITNGGAVSTSKRCYIGRASGSTGAVTISGAGSTWTILGSMLEVGDEGDGTLEITNGGAASSGSVRIGNEPGSTGAVTVSGAGSIWTASPVVGDEGDGRLDITDGGAVSSVGGYIGDGSGSTGAVMVSGAGSTWTSSRYLCIGERGVGTLEITNGGAVSSSTAGDSYYCTIGDTGAVTVSGVGSTWTNSSDLRVGYSGAATLKIVDGGLVSVAGGLTIDYNGGGDSFINMSTGGMLALSGSPANSLLAFLGLIEGADAIRYWDNSISDWADITGGINGVDYTLNYLTDGDLAGHTLLTVPEPSTATIITPRDNSNVKKSEPARNKDETERLEVKSDGSNRNSRFAYLRFDVSGLTVDDTDTVTLDLNLEDRGTSNAATLNVWSLNDGVEGETTWDSSLTYNTRPDGTGNIPNADLTFLATYSYGIAGNISVDIDTSTFQTLLGSDTNDELTLVLSNDSGDIKAQTFFSALGNTGGNYVPMLTIVPEPFTPGDTNDDDIVDGFDLANLVAQFGGPPDVESADFNGDNFVDLDDFSILRAYFGSGVVAAPDAEFGATTPEPATLILMATGLPLLLKRKRKFRLRREYADVPRDLGRFTDSDNQGE